MQDNHRRSIRAAILPLAMLGGAILAGSAMAVPGNIVVVGEDQSPEGLNQVDLGGATVVTHRVLCPVQCENLLGFDAKTFQYTPVLAETVPSTTNGLVKTSPKFTVTFKIRREAKWSDGVSVTSADVKFTVDQMLDPKFKAASRTGFDQIASVETPDAQTAVVIFKKPYAPWRDVFSPSGGAILIPKHIVEGKDFNTLWNGDDPKVVIGTGPYVIDSFKKDESAVLLPNTKYWGSTKPKLDKIVFTFLKSTQTQDVQFRSGEINWIQTPVFALIPELRKIDKTKVDAPSGLTWEHLAFNQENPVMKDINVRRAIAYAINPAELIKRSTGGFTKPLFSFLLPEQRPYYKPSWAKYKTNPGAVSKALTASGYRKNGKGIWAKGGKELNITFTTIAGNSTRENNFKLMKAQLAKVGIKMTPIFDENFFDANGPNNTGKYMVAEFAFSGSSDPSQSQLFRSDVIPTKANGFSGQNTYRIKDKTLDSLLNRADQALAIPTRVSLQKQIQDRIASNLYLVPLYQRPEVTAYADNLQGVIVNPTQIGAADKTETGLYIGGKASRERERQRWVGALRRRPTPPDHRPE